MQTEHDPNQQSRENMLAVTLVMIVGGMILFFLYMISLGIVGNVLAGGAILVIVGALHYLLWGQSMSADVAAEREALRKQDARGNAAPPKSAISNIQRTPTIEPPRDGPKPPADAFKDMSRTKGITRTEPES